VADRTLEPVRQVDALRQALADAGLPADDIDPAITTFYRLSEDGRCLGWAGVERHGAEGLLRSVVVPDDQRGVGVGTDLIDRVMRAAAGDGIARLWLLTETAAPFFARLGFARADRGQASEPIRASSEFRGVCPASAECMVADLRGR
jgi:N-acetylglutamate synthase-like GNAT family acetyltransferase